MTRTFKVTVDSPLLTERDVLLKVGFWPILQTMPGWDYTLTRLRATPDPILFHEVSWTVTVEWSRFPWSSSR